MFDQIEKTMLLFGTCCGFAFEFGMGSCALGYGMCRSVFIDGLTSRKTSKVDVPIFEGNMGLYFCVFLAVVCKKRGRIF